MTTTPTPEQIANWKMLCSHCNTTHHDLERGLREATAACEALIRERDEAEAEAAKQKDAADKWCGAYAKLDVRRENADALVKVLEHRLSIVISLRDKEFETLDNAIDLAGAERDEAVKERDEARAERDALKAKLDMATAALDEIAGWQPTYYDNRDNECAQALNDTAHEALAKLKDMP